MLGAKDPVKGLDKEDNIHTFNGDLIDLITAHFLWGVIKRLDSYC